MNQRASDAPRNGYVYAVSEATSRGSKLMGAWGSERPIDESRRKTEAEAFDKLVGEVEKTWNGVVRQFNPAEKARGFSG